MVSNQIRLNLNSSQNVLRNGKGLEQDLLTYSSLPANLDSQSLLDQQSNQN
jgi:hypothetical protein